MHRSFIGSAMPRSCIEAGIQRSCVHGISHTNQILHEPDNSGRASTHRAEVHKLRSSKVAYLVSHACAHDNEALRHTPPSTHAGSGLAVHRRAHRTAVHLALHVEAHDPQPLNVLYTLHPALLQARQHILVVHLCIEASQHILVASQQILVVHLCIEATPKGDPSALVMDKALLACAVILLFL